MCPFQNFVLASALKSQCCFGKRKNFLLQSAQTVFSALQNKLMPPEQQLIQSFDTLYILRVWTLNEFNFIYFFIIWVECSVSQTILYKYLAILMTCYNLLVFYQQRVLTRTHTLFSSKGWSGHYTIQVDHGKVFQPILPENLITTIYDFT